MANPPPTLFYTDDITYQASRWLKSYHLSSRGGRLTVNRIRDESGDANACVALDHIRGSLRGDINPRIKPRVLAMSFTSNVGTILYPNTDYDGGERAALGSADYVGAGSSESGVGEWRTDPGGALIGYAVEEDAAIWSDVDSVRCMKRIMAAADFVHVPVYWVVSPPLFADFRPSVYMAEIAQSYGAHIVQADTAVASGSGSWVSNKPCLMDEGAPEGCVGGNVIIRSGDDFAFVGEEYSSGARRWASAAVQGMPMVSSTPDPNCYVWECPVSSS